MRLLHFPDSPVSHLILSIRLSELAVDVFQPMNSPQPASNVSWSALEFSRLIGSHGGCSEQTRRKILDTLADHLSLDEATIDRLKLRYVICIKRTFIFRNEPSLLSGFTGSRR